MPCKFSIPLGKDFFAPVSFSNLQGHNRPMPPYNFGLPIFCHGPMCPEIRHFHGCAFGRAGTGRVAEQKQQKQAKHSHALCPSRAGKQGPLLAVLCASLWALLVLERPKLLVPSPFAHCPPSLPCPNRRPSQQP